MRGPVPEEVASREKSSEPRAGGGGTRRRGPRSRRRGRVSWLLIRDRRAARTDPAVPEFPFLLGQVHCAPPPASPLSFVVRISSRVKEALGIDVLGWKFLSSHRLEG